MMTVSNNITSNMLSRLGFNDRFEAESKSFRGLYVGRVISQYNKVYKLMSQQGELNAEVSGKFNYEASDLSAYPVVGDFVMIDRTSDKDGNAIISQVLGRKSILKRKSAGTSGEGQIIASNVDTVFICMSANSDFNIRRAERYLSIVWDSGAIPVIVITKSDLADNIEEKLGGLGSVTVGVEVLVTSAIEGDIHDAFQSHLVEGQTIALLDLQV
jgi:ribosome biogenesis GTPase